MTFIPFDNLRKQGYKIDTQKNLSKASTVYRFSKGEFCYQHSVDDYSADPKYYAYLEEHVQRSFKDSAERKIKEMTQMYGVDQGAISQMQMGQMYNEQANIARSYAMMNALPPWEAEARKKEQSDRDKETAKKVAENKKKVKMLIVINHKRKVI